MNIFNWPSVLRHHADVEIWLSNSARSAGRSFTGAERLVASDAGFWNYQITTMAWTPAQVLSWRGLMAQVEGRLNVIRMPFWDDRNDIVASSGLEAMRQAVPAAGIPYTGVSGNPLHSDGSGFAADFGASVVQTYRPARATSIRVTLPTGMQPIAGQHFSDGDYPYRVKTATLRSGSTYDVTFVPPLRQPIAAGREVSFTRLFCLVRLADEAAQAIDRDPAHILRFPVAMVEAIA